VLRGKNDTASDTLRPRGNYYRRQFPLSQTVHRPINVLPICMWILPIYMWVLSIYMWVTRWSEHSRTVLLLTFHHASLGV
jgi:hypothetical protein